MNIFFGEDEDEHPVTNHFDPGVYARGLCQECSIDTAVEKTETFREKMEKAFQRTTTEAQSRFHM